MNILILAGLIISIIALGLAFYVMRDSKRMVDQCIKETAKVVAESNSQSILSLDIPDYPDVSTIININR